MTTHLLIFTPVTPGGLQFATVQSVVGQYFAGAMTWEIGRCNPYPPPDVRNVLAQYSYARQLCLSGPYDALVTIEQDMIVPPHALTALWDEGRAVVYGTYMLRHGAPVINALRRENNRNPGMSLSLYDGAVEIARKAKRVEVSGVGFGCTLIRREVLEAIPFRQDEAGNGVDMSFARDCLRQNIVQAAHFGVACGHIHEGAILETESTEPGSTVATEPPQTEQIPVKVTILQAVNILSGSLTEGQEIELSAEEAQMLLDVGYAKLAEGVAKAPKVPRK